MSLRVIAAFILIPLAVGIERLAWYLSRSAMYERMRELGGDAIPLFQASSAYMLVGSVVAGAIAAALLPRVVIVACAVCAAAGYMLASTAADADAFSLAMSVASIGAGGLKVCLYGLAILMMPTPRLRTVFILVTYLTTNVAAFVASLGGGLLADSGVIDNFYRYVAVLVIVGSVPAVAIIIVDKVAVRAPRPRLHHGRAILGAMAMVGATLPLFAAMNMSASAFYELGSETGLAATSFGIMRGVMTLVTMASVVVVGLFFMSGPGRRASLSLLVGGGMLLAAVGAALALPSSLVTAGMAQIVFSIAETVAPLALARALATQHPRVVTLVAAVVVSFIAAAALPSTWLFLVISLLALVAGGVALLKYGPRLDDWLDEERAPEPPKESWLSGRQDPSSVASQASSPAARS